MSYRFEWTNISNGTNGHGDFTMTYADALKKIATLKSTHSKYEVIVYEITTYCQQCDAIKQEDEMEDASICGDCYMDWMDQEAEYPMGDQIVRW
jgi:predicted Zn-ribbon and HTH transcriptional regulator